MKDWVIPYLKSDGMKYSEQKFEDIKRVDFDCLQSNREHRGAFMNISTVLMEKLNCNFQRGKGRERKEDKEEREDFTLTFCSVLADLEREVFAKLSDSKNIFIVFGTPEPAYVKSFSLTETSLPVPKESLRVIVFERKVMSYHRLALRWIIAHELAHAISEKGDEEEADKIALGWGFKIEKEEFKDMKARKGRG